MNNKTTRPFSICQQCLQHLRSSRVWQAKNTLSIRQGFSSSTAQNKRDSDTTNTSNPRSRMHNTNTSEEPSLRIKKYASEGDSIDKSEQGRLRVKKFESEGMPIKYEETKFNMGPNVSLERRIHDGARREDSYHDRDEPGESSGSGFELYRPVGGQLANFTERTVFVKPKRNITRHDPDSQFLVGYSPIRAALKARLRTRYCLYIYTGGNRTDESMKKAKQLQLRGLKVEHTTDLSLLDAMSRGLPHNGFVLECSKRPVPVAKSLPPCLRYDGSLSLLSETGGPHDPIHVRDPKREYPFVILIDQVIGSGNLGAIIRTAYYLGVDAIILSNSCAPLSEKVVKTSSGASEFMPIYTTNNLAGFVNWSTEVRWKFFAAMPEPSKGILKANRTKKGKQWHDLESIGDPLHHGATCLVIGSEAEGISSTVLARIQNFVSIRSGNITRDAMVDSFNVAVATALLCHRFLNPVDKKAFPKIMAETRGVHVGPATKSAEETSRMFNLERDQMREMNEKFDQREKEGWTTKGEEDEDVDEDEDPLDMDDTQEDESPVDNDNAEAKAEEEEEFVGWKREFDEEVDDLPDGAADVTTFGVASKINLPFAKNSGVDKRKGDRWMKPRSNGRHNEQSRERR